MASIIKSSLEQIFGAALPKTTTNFHTVGNTAVFVTTDTDRTPVTEYVDVEMTAAQKDALRERKMLGSFGWALQ